jgi:RNA polymerase sigma-70 factor (ECF subfamily)
MVIYNDGEWLIQARQGNDSAFAQLVEMYQSPVYNLCYRMLGDPQEAEDAAQESFWRAYQALKRYDPQRSFITWLLSIAAHYCIDEQRRRRLPTVEIDDFAEEIIPDHGPSPENSITQTEEEKQLHKLLAEMNSQDRAAIILRYWYDLSDQEIGEALSLSVSAVKSRLHRGRLLLAKRWQSTQEANLINERNHYESPAI